MSVICSLFKNPFKGTLVLSTSFGLLHRFFHITSVNFKGLENTYGKFLYFWNLQDIGEVLNKAWRDLSNYWGGKKVAQIPHGCSVEKLLAAKLFFKTAKLIAAVVGVGSWLKSIGAITSQRPIYPFIEDLTGMIGYGGASYMTFINRETPESEDLQAARNQRDYRRIHYYDALLDVSTTIALSAACLFSLMSRVSWAKASLAGRVDGLLFFFNTLATVGMVAQHGLNLESYKAN